MKSFLFFTAILFLLSCGVKKVYTLPKDTTHTVVAVPSYSHEVVTRMIVDRYAAWRSEVQTIHYAMQGGVKMPNNPTMRSAGLIVDMYIMKDSVLWGSFKSALLGFEVLRVVCTKQQVEIISSFIQPTVQKMTYEELEKLYHIKADFSMIESMLLNNLGTDYTITNKTDSTIDVDYPLLYLDSVKLSTNTSSVIFPNAFDATFPLQCKNVVSSKSSSNTYQLSLYRYFSEENHNLTEFKLQVHFTKDEQTIFKLDQKTVFIDINQEFVFPPNE